MYPVKIWGARTYPPKVQPVKFEETSNPGPLTGLMEKHYFPKNLLFFNYLHMYCLFNLWSAERFDLHWLIESILEGFWSLHLCQMVSGGCLCGEILSRCFNINLSVVRSLPWGPRGLAVRRLPRMQEVVIWIPPSTKFVFYNLIYFIEWNVRNCFVKLI